MSWTIESEAAGANSARYVLKDEADVERKRWPVRASFRDVVTEAFEEYGPYSGGQPVLYLNYQDVWTVGGSWDF